MGYWLFLPPLEALAQLVKQGKVRSIGLSNETPYGTTLPAEVLAEIDKIRWEIRDPAL